MGLPAAGEPHHRRRDPGARLVVLPEAGHFPFSEEPDQFHEAVGDFLAACTGSSAGCHPSATPVANT